MECQENFRQTGEKSYLTYFMPEVSMKSASDIMTKIHHMKDFDNFFYLVYSKDKNMIYYYSKPNNGAALMQGNMLDDYIERIIDEYGSYPVIRRSNNVVQLLKNLSYWYSLSKDVQYKLNYTMVCKTSDIVVVLRNLKEIQDFYSSNMFEETFVLPYLIPITPWDK